MQDIKGKSQFVRFSVSMRLGIRENIDSLGETIKEITGIDANRSKLIAILADLAREANDDIDYSKIRDEATLQQEVERAVFKRLERERVRWPAKD